MPINEWSDDITILELEDEPVFSDDVDAFAKRLEQSEDGQLPDVVINMGGVSHVNSSNIAQLLRIRKILQDRGGRLRVCSVQDQVWTVLMVTGLDQIFGFTEDVMTSIASLQIEES